MNIILNGQPHNLTDGQSLSELLTQQGYEAMIVAVAVNANFVPKTAYGTTTLNEGDEIEIVAPMQGG